MPIGSAAVAILASLDTKAEEVAYLRDLIQGDGHAALVIDLSTRTEIGGADYPPSAFIARAGVTFGELSAASRDRSLDLMQRACMDLVADLYSQGRLSAVLAIGGLQNTMMATAAMRRLPLGVPKVMVSTVASGQRTFGQFIGASDIVMVPSIADLAGRNPITDRVLENAAGMVCGMIRFGGKPVSHDQAGFIGVTVMGATSDGIMPAVGELRRSGFQVACFHSTGAGGPAMEMLVESKAIAGVMDLCLHEVTSEMLDLGFSIGSRNRLAKIAESGVPAVVTPGGADFIDLPLRDFLSDGPLGDHRVRRYIKHNSQIAHVKLLPEEMDAVSKTIVERLNRTTGPMTVVLPLHGFRSHTRPGEALHDPEVDQVLIENVRRLLKPQIRLIELDCNLNDPEFAHCAAQEMIRLLKAPRP